MNAPDNLYETEALRAVTGPAIRPGGLTLTERALDLCALPQGALVLDVGCGTGETVKYMRHNRRLRAVGLDRSWTLLSEGREHPAPPMLINAKAEAVPIADARLTAVFCECVLSLLPTPQAALVEWHRVLAPGGHLIVSDLFTRVASMEACQSNEIGHCGLDGAVDRRTLNHRMTSAGFDVLLFEDHTRLLRHLAAQLVWTYGSLAAFWSAAGAGCRGNSWSSGSRLGYYLMVARKGVDRHG